MTRDEAEQDESLDHEATAADPPLTVADESRTELDRQIGVGPSRLGILLFGFLLAAGAILGFGLLAGDVYEHQSIVFDSRAGYFLHGFSTPALDSFMRFATFMGSIPAIAAVFLVAVAALLFARRRREALFLAVALAGSVTLNRILKSTFERPRPILPWSKPLSEYSFPSGHSMNSFVFYISLALVIRVVAGRRHGAVAFVGAAIIVALVGISRIYLGYHYFSDVIGGYAAGLFWLVASATAIEGRS